MARGVKSNERIKKTSNAIRAVFFLREIWGRGEKKKEKKEKRGRRIREKREKNNRVGVSKRKREKITSAEKIDDDKKNLWKKIFLEFKKYSPLWFQDSTYIHQILSCWTTRARLHGHLITIASSSTKITVVLNRLSQFLELALLAVFARRHGRGCSILSCRARSAGMRCSNI